ncbi:hypothetical protein ANCCAN_03976 [Ancylostoma caninum]|uniref:Uncharacterized protein n=1 Tax=Ancylostoma caninum TaxID=29170 RepID=A0A368H3W1_ANCCA|nr:hypothetical protein ANCCAN_03976 [Ancylostoma caninum]
MSIRRGSDGGRRCRERGGCALERIGRHDVMIVLGHLHPNVGERRHYRASVVFGDNEKAVQRLFQLVEWDSCSDLALEYKSSVLIFLEEVSRKDVKKYLETWRDLIIGTNADKSLQLGQTHIVGCSVWKTLSLNVAFAVWRPSVAETMQVIFPTVLFDTALANETTPSGSTASEEQAGSPDSENERRSWSASFTATVTMG